MKNPEDPDSRAKVRYAARAHCERPARGERERGQVRIPIQPMKPRPLESSQAEWDVQIATGEEHPACITSPSPSSQGQTWRSISTIQRRDKTRRDISTTAIHPSLLLMAHSPSLPFRSACFPPYGQPLLEARVVLERLLGSEWPSV